MRSCHSIRHPVNPEPKPIRLAKLFELLGVDERRPDGTAFGWCPAHDNPRAFRVRIARRTFDGLIKIECRGGGCREASIAAALSRRSGRTITAEDLLNIVEPVR